MSTSNELFTPDTVDEQIDQLADTNYTKEGQLAPDLRLISHLRAFYEAEGKQVDTVSLARVAERLERAASTAVAYDIKGEEDQRISVFAGHGVLSLFPVRPTRRRRPLPMLSLIAAVAMLTLLVGSMLAVFTLARIGMNGTVTGSDENSAFIFDGTLFKIDLTHQSVGWSKRFALTGFVAAEQQPVSHGIVYASGTNRSSRNNSQANVYAFHANDGSVAWRTQLIPPSHPAYGYVGNYPLLPTPSSATAAGFVTQPVVANGLVYVMSGNGQIFALDATTGNLRWIYDMHVTGITAVNLAVGTQEVIFATHSNEIIALNGINGSKLWVKSIGSSQSIDHAAFDEGTLYVASDSVPVHPASTFVGRISAFDAATGQQQWSKSIQTGSFTTPVVADGKVFVGAQNNDATSSVYAFNVSNGSLAWQHKFDIAVPPQFKSGTYLMAPIVDDGKLYVQAYSSSAISIRGPFIPNVRVEYAFNAATGAWLWQHQQPRQDEMVFSFFERNNTLYLVGYTITQPTSQLVIESLAAETGRAG